MFSLKKKFHIFPLLVLVVGLILATPASAAVVNVKLNSPFTGPGNVLSFKIAPDGSRVVYRAAEDTIVELYSVPVDGSSGPTKLNGALTTGGDVSGFEISPDSTRVVYRADQDLDEKFELYSVSLSGGSITKLNDAAMADNRDVSGFRISPDSSRVVYLADEDSLGENELFSVLINGGGKAKLNPDLVDNRDVRDDFQISPDSNHVVYRADQDIDEIYELYSAPIAATGGVKLSGPLVSGGGVLRFLISPDSSRVVYHADQDTLDVRELYSAPIATAGSAVQLNTDPVPGGEVFEGFLISPNSNHVVYRADQDTDNVRELYSVPLAGGSPTKLNDFSAIITDDRDVRPGFQISPDSSRVVYIADKTGNQRHDVFSVQLDGTGRVNLSGVSGSSDVSFGLLINPLISPDGSRVVYRADANTDEVFELYSAPIATAGSSVKLNNTPVTDGDVASGINIPDFLISPDSSQVVYRGDLDTDEVYELYTAPIDASGGQVKLNGTQASGGDVEPESFLITADSIYVAYLADQDTDSVIELYSSYQASLPDLSVSKTVDDATPVPGQTITYTVSVYNSDTIEGASGVVISDILPGDLTYVNSSTSNGSIYDPVGGVWNVGDVGASASVTLNIEVTVSSLPGSSITNTAALSASIPSDPNSSNNEDSAVITVSGEGGRIIYLPLIFKNFNP